VKFVCRRHAALLLQRSAPKTCRGVVPTQCNASAPCVMSAHTQGEKAVEVPSGGGDDAAEAGGVRRVASRGAGSADAGHKRPNFHASDASAGDGCIGEENARVVLEGAPCVTMFPIITRTAAGPSVLGFHRSGGVL
jgi:hypothetical protein